MRHNIIFTLAGSLIIILLSLGACTADIDSPTPPEEQQDSFLKIEINVADTRAGLDATSFEVNDSIFIAVIDSENPRLFRTSKATYNGQTWNLDTQINLNDENEDGTRWGDDVKVLAFYPYELGYSFNNEKEGCIPSSYNGIDQTKMMFMYGNTSGINRSNPNAKISFRHAMSRITLNIKNTSQETIRISHIFVSNSNDNSSNRYLLIPNFLSAYSGLQDYTENGDMLGIGDEFSINPDSSEMVDVLMYPTEFSYEKFTSENINGGLTFTLVTHVGSSLEARDINFDLNMPLWRPGQQYTYPVTLKEEIKEDLTGEINGHEYVDLGLSVLWATCNIGAETPEDYGLYFQWGATEGHARVGDTISDGYIFDDSWYIYKMTQEQMLAQGIIEYDKNLSEENFYKLTPNYDAATKNWGEGWRMPTIFEIKELCENVSAKAPYKFESTIEGYENKFIEFPQNVAIFSNDGFVSDADNLYWGSNFKGDVSYILLYYMFNNKIHIIQTQKSGLYWGMNIRPVADKPHIEQSLH